MKSTLNISDLHIQKWMIFVLCLILFACKSESNTRKSVSDFFSAIQNHNTIDSLLNRISNDTLALSSYLSLARSTRDNYAEMKTYCQLGLYYMSNYDFLKAIEYHTYYLESAEKNGDQIQMLEALNTLAYDYKKIYALDESSQYYFKALSLMNKLATGSIPKVQSEKAKTLNGLGNIYLKINYPDEAIPYLQKSLEIETRQNNVMGQAKNLADIGSFFEIKIEYDSAYQYFDRSLQLYIKANSVSGINMCYARIGNLYMMQGDYHGASVYIESVYNSLQYTSDRLNWLNACFSLANICIKKGEYDKAETFLQEGLQVSENLRLPSYLEKASMLLSELYKQQGNTAAAFEAYSMSVSYAKRFRSERNISRIMTHRLGYEKNSNEKEKTLLTAQLKNIKREKTKTTLFILLVFIALAAFIIILIQQYRLKKQKTESSLRLEKIKSDFYINIFHEFKTPVTIITGLIERFRNKMENHDLLKDSIDLDILSRQSQNLLSLINEMSSATDMQKIEKCSNTIHDNIVNYLSCLFENFSVLAENKRINYSFHNEIKELNMDYYPETLRLIFSNLLSNLIQYSQENDKVSVGVDCNTESKRCIISISNSSDTVQKLASQQTFKPYFQDLSYNKEQNMVEISLLFTKQLVEKINGTIELKKQSRDETIFIITLPIINEKADDNKHTLIIDNVSGKSFEDRTAIQFPPEKENVRVLVVENNRDMAYYLTSILEENYHLFTVDTGIKAFQKATEIMPDIIISNIIIPGMNGYDLCKEIKSSDVTSHIPVILLSAHTSKEERVKGFRCGADAFLCKPVCEEELLAVIDQLVEVRKQISSKYALTTVNIGKNKEQEVIKNDFSMEFIKQITDLIYKEIDNTENIIDTISSKSCLSPSQLNRRIKAATGMTTSNYILKVRLNKAGQLLSQSQKPIGEIAMDCGFNDFAYFSRTFKKEFRMTPTTFQRLPRSVN